MAKKKTTVKKSVKVTKPLYAKLNAVKFGLALGIICAIGMVILPLWVLATGKGIAWILLISEFYIGYDYSIAGTILGAIYGFIDGFVGGAIFAWLYNKFVM